MTDIRLSIIIPIYNVEQYLAQCLDSVFTQNLDGIEVICINDGSTDGSKLILKNYKEKFPSLIVIEQKNGGLAKARNIGFKIATGEYIYFLDSDDYLFQGTIQIILEFAISNKLDVGLFNAVNDNKKQYYTTNQNISGILTGIQFFEYFYKINEFFPPSVQWLYIYRKDFLDSNNIHFPEGNLQEDEPYTIKAFYFAQRAATLNISLVFHRVFRLGSITQSAHIQHLIDAKTAWQQTFYFLKKEKCANMYFYHKIFSLYQNTITKLTNKNLIKYRKGFLSKNDFQVMRNCSVNSELFKYYFYYSTNYNLFKWYLAPKKFKLMIKMINRILVLYYKTIVLHERKTAIFNSYCEL